MAHPVYFIDTSILVNILRVPKKCQDADAVKRELEILMKENYTMILPRAALVETGNHIAHIDDAKRRRTCAEKFSQLIMKSLNGEAPWTYNAHQVTEDTLKMMAKCFPDYAQQYDMGWGDLSILSECMDYQRLVGRHTKVKVWSKDQHFDVLEGIESISSISEVVN